MSTAQLVGADAHNLSAAAIQAAYRSLPHGRTVRLSKRTSNLFRTRHSDSSGLDVADLDGVISIDADTRTADVQGMCTYEHLVEQTLAQGLMPLVVPQLKTITVGGAVTGLGIESSSLRYGLPHESVLEMDILTGNGDIVTASETSHSELFECFPNSYGSLGYALRLRIKLMPVSPFLALRHVKFVNTNQLIAAIERIASSASWEGEPVDFVDGVSFSLEESYLTLARWADSGKPSDYGGQQIFFRSIQRRTHDCLTTSDYLWRWDTDWFWCSAAFGAQHPWIRRVWPRRLRRSDVYHRLVRWDNRWSIVARLDQVRGRPAQERVVQDVEVPVERLGDFLSWFATNVGMSPVWLCPLRTARRWPLYPLDAARTYVNIGFWGTVPIDEGAADGDKNRALERAVAAFDGHKSLYSDVYYDQNDFDRIYGGEVYRVVRDRYDRAHKLNDLFSKVCMQS